MKACLTKSKWSLFLLVDHPNGWASFVNFFQEDHQSFMHQWTRVNRSQQKKVGLDWPLRKNLQWLHQMILFLKAVFGFFKDSLISPLYLAVHFRISGFHRCAAHPGDFHTMGSWKRRFSTWWVWRRWRNLWGPVTKPVVTGSKFKRTTKNHSAACCWWKKSGEHHLFYMNILLNMGCYIENTLTQNKCRYTLRCYF